MFWLASRCLPVLIALQCVSGALLGLIVCPISLHSPLTAFRFVLNFYKFSFDGRAISPILSLILCILPSDMATARTTGSADFKAFAQSLMNDTSWDLTAGPTGLDFPRLLRLLAFLTSAIDLPRAQRGGFGPNKSRLLELRQRLLGVIQFQGTKGMLFEVFAAEVLAIIKNWPPSASNLRSAAYAAPLPTPASSNAPPAAGSSDTNASAPGPSPAPSPAPTSAPGPSSSSAHGTPAPAPPPATDSPAPASSSAANPSPPPPPTTDPPAPAPSPSSAAVDPASFWTSLAQSAQQSNPEFFPSVLLEVHNLTYSGSKSDLASRIFIERERFKPANVSGSMSARDFTRQRQSIARTFGFLQGVPLPDHVPDDIARAAIHAFLDKQLLLARADASLAASSSTPGENPVYLGSSLSNPDLFSNTPGVSVNLGSSSLNSNPSVSVAVGSSGATAGMATRPPSTLSTGATDTSPAVSRLNRSFNNLIDHLQQSGVHVGDADQLGKDNSLPAYMTNVMRRDDNAMGKIPDTITDAMAAADKKFLDRLNFIYSERNFSGIRIHEDVEREMQERFAADDMTLLGAEKRGSVRKRARVKAIKIQAHQDFRRMLEVRQQRYKLQRFAEGNVLMKQQVEELKSSEFLLYSQIRVRFRALHADEGDRKRALAAISSESDATFARAVFNITPAQAKSYLSSLHKSSFKPKRAPKRQPTRDAPSDGPPKRSKTNICFHCGATGARYHNFRFCPLWKAGKPPKDGTVHAKQLSMGKVIPKPKKS